MSFLFLLLWFPLVTGYTMKEVGLFLDSDSAVEKWG